MTGADKRKWRPVRGTGAIGETRLTSEKGGRFFWEQVIKVDCEEPLFLPGPLAGDPHKAETQADQSEGCGLRSSDEVRGQESAAVVASSGLVAT